MGSSSESQVKNTLRIQPLAETPMAEMNKMVRYLVDLWLQTEVSGMSVISNCLVCLEEQKFRSKAYWGVSFSNLAKSVPKYVEYQSGKETRTL
jgi:hypothetical protein